MASRKPATPGEIAKVLNRYLNSEHVRQGAIMAPRWDFYKYAQAQLRTTARNIRQWVGAAAAGPGALFKIVEVNYGVVYGTLEPNDTGSLHQFKTAHFGAFDELAFGASPTVDDHGVVMDDKERRAEYQSFVIPAYNLTELVEEAKKRDVLLRENRKAEHIAELEAAEAKHGEAIALLRGLLHRADINRSRHMSIRHNAEMVNDRVDMSTAVTIDLYGPQLDALAVVLKEFGIKPRIRTAARSQPEAAPATGA